MTDFSQNRAGTGTREWSEFSSNLGIGCQHECRYCFARAQALRFKKIETRDDWRFESINQQAVDRRWGKKNGVIMFPTQHDITPFYLEAAVIVLKKMLAAGNQVLIVSKPHAVCIDRLCYELRHHKEQILFRFSITSMDVSLTNFWEPGAPSPYERLGCLKTAYKLGFQTSVSMEPMLSGVGDAEVTFQNVVPWVTDKVWMGKMNKVRQRLDMNNPEERQAAEGIERLQADGQIWQLFRALDGHPKVAWKDSIKQVIKTYEEDTCAVR